MTTAPESISITTRRRALTAWANAIGASAQQLSKEDWAFVQREDFDSVVVVQIDGVGLAAGPADALDVIRTAPERTLLDAVALAELLPYGACPIGTADLFFAERSPRASAIAATIATPQDVSSVRSGVSSSEWDESGVEDMDRTWASGTSELGAAAVAGFEPWNFELAQLGVVATPQQRGAGFAYAAAAAATEAALAEGFVAQWRSRQGNHASKRLAQRLGFAQLGIQAAVRLAGNDQS